MAESGDPAQRFFSNRGEDMISELRTRLTRELDDLVEELTVHLPARLGGEHSTDDYRACVDLQRAFQARVHFLHGTLSALDGVSPGMLPARGAGFGSRVRLIDLDTGARIEYTLMVGDSIDLDAGQISLASPVGQALLGRGEGAEVVVATPAGRRRLRILSVERLEDGLGRQREPPAVRVA
jgi:transcription elongation factor GreA